VEIVGKQLRQMMPFLNPKEAPVAEFAGKK
jgi:hypothetical protein